VKVQVPTVLTSEREITTMGRLSRVTVAVCLSLASVHALQNPVLSHGLQPSFHTRAVTVMAGFGGAAKKKGKPKNKAKAGLTAKQSWDVFRELRDTSDQVQTSSIYARLPDDGAKWLNVGGVIVEAPGTREQAVTLHKRLILEQYAGPIRFLRRGSTHGLTALARWQCGTSPPEARCARTRARLRLQH
jgi:hypothetical protein